MKTMSKLQSFMEHQEDVALYLVAGGLLGFYRDGRLIPGDSDVDIRFAVRGGNPVIDRQLRDIVIGDEPHERDIAVIDMHEWGDTWNPSHLILPAASSRIACGLRQRSGTWLNASSMELFLGQEVSYEIMNDEIFHLVKQRLCLPPTGGICTQNTSRAELEFNYGPHWFIKMPWKGQELDQWYAWAQPSHPWHSYWTDTIGVIRGMDLDENEVISSNEVDQHVTRAHIDAMQYAAQISARDKCRAASMLTFLLAYAEAPHILKDEEHRLVGRYDQSRFFPFPQCEPEAKFRVYVDMTADLFHYGHANFLRQSRLFGQEQASQRRLSGVHVIVGVHSDEDVAAYKRTPIMNMQERMQSVQQSRYVDEVVGNAPLSIPKTYLLRLGVDAVLHGDDFSQDTVDSMYGAAIKMGIFHTVPYTQNISTSELIQRIQRANATKKTSTTINVHDARTTSFVGLPSLNSSSSEEDTRARSQSGIEVVNPLTLDIGKRFDIVVETTYAIFLHRGNVPTFVQSMYTRHLEACNTFQEHCVFVGQKTWLDATTSCVVKTMGRDLQQTFATLNSIALESFDRTKVQISTTSAGLPLNGTHEIASAIALGLSAVTVQRDSIKPVDNINWDFAHFARRGFEDLYADFAMLQWTLHVAKTRTVVFWPEAAANTQKMTKARTIVQNCGNVLYEKSVSVNRDGLHSFALHAYGDQKWLSSKTKQLQMGFRRQDEKRPVVVMFILPTSSKHLRSCKVALRSHFDLPNPKSSVHISDYHDEAVLIAEMVLNANSAFFLNHHKHSDCQKVAVELASRLTSSSVQPGLYVLPQDIMVDSGAVMSFFGLRKFNDVDLLFERRVNHNLLGERNGISVQPHTFKTTEWGAETWGEYHFVGSCKDVGDLFHDPANYGYCHGLKFVSLPQLVRYKENRRAMVKDEDDVAMIQTFLSWLEDT